MKLWLHHGNLAGLLCGIFSFDHLGDCDWVRVCAALEPLEMQMYNQQLNPHDGAIEDGG